MACFRSRNCVSHEEPALELYTYLCVNASLCVYETRCTNIMYGMMVRFCVTCERVIAAGSDDMPAPSL